MLANFYRPLTLPEAVTCIRYACAIDHLQALGAVEFLFRTFGKYEENSKCVDGTELLEHVHAWCLEISNDAATRDFVNSHGARFFELSGTPLFAFNPRGDYSKNLVAMMSDAAQYIEEHADRELEFSSCDFELLKCIDVEALQSDLKKNLIKLEDWKYLCPDRFTNGKGLDLLVDVKEWPSYLTAIDVVKYMRQTAYGMPATFFDLVKLEGDQYCTSFLKELATHIRKAWFDDDNVNLRTLVEGNSTMAANIGRYVYTLGGEFTFGRWFDIFTCEEVLNEWIDDRLNGEEWLLPYVDKDKVWNKHFFHDNVLHHDKFFSNCDTVWHHLFSEPYTKKDMQYDSFLHYLKED